MNQHYDALETRDCGAREAALMAALPGQVAHARHSSAAFNQILQDINPAQVSSRQALAQLPVTRKHELLERQQAARTAGGDVFGGFSAIGFGTQMPRIFSSPGPIYEPEGAAKDYWRMARAMVAAGFRSGELIHNCFSYHFVPAGSMMESGAHAMGCTVFAGGNVFGGFSAVAFGAKMPRIFASPGPIYEPEGGARDYWRMARAIHAAGFRPNELIHNCFS